MKNTHKHTRGQYTHAYNTHMWKTHTSTHADNTHTWEENTHNHTHTQTAHTHGEHTHWQCTHAHTIHTHTGNNTHKHHTQTWATHTHTHANTRTSHTDNTHKHEHIHSRTHAQTHTHMPICSLYWRYLKGAVLCKRIFPQKDIISSLSSSWQRSERLTFLKCKAIRLLQSEREAHDCASKFEGLMQLLTQSG